MKIQELIKLMWLQLCGIISRINPLTNIVLFVDTKMIQKDNNELVTKSVYCLSLWNHLLISISKNFIEVSFHKNPFLIFLAEDLDHHELTWIQNKYQGHMQSKSNVTEQWQAVVLLNAIKHSYISTPTRMIGADQFRKDLHKKLRERIKNA